jgi:hypothetical protein
MSEINDVPSAVERMKQYMALRGLRPNTVSTFTRCARRFLAHAGKLPTGITTTDVEGFLMHQHRAPRRPGSRR